MPSDTTKLAECEFWVISEMNSYLIVHHPYRTLKELAPVLQLTPDELNTASQVINDACITDLPLIYPPHIIALTAIFLSVVLKPSVTHGGMQSASSSTAMMAGMAAAVGQVGLGTSAHHNTQGRISKLIDWYAESKVDMEAIIDATQEIVSLYEVWDEYAATERAIKDQLVRMVKQRGT